MLVASCGYKASRNIILIWLYVDLTDNHEYRLYVVSDIGWLGIKLCHLVVVSKVVLIHIDRSTFYPSGLSSARVWI